STSNAFIQPFGKQRVTSGVETATIYLVPGARYNYNVSYYIGPQDMKILSAGHQGFELIVSFGVFDPISKGLLYVMRFLNEHIRSWGACIILISVMIFLLLFPLTAKSMASMKKMQELQPEIEQLRKLYKDQPQKLNKDIMNLYRENKVNPFGGCLPMFLQIPVFFALYQALMRSVDLKGAEFLWIEDLAEPDRLFTLKDSFPVIGNEINLLPLIMVVAMFMQQKLSMKSSSGSTTMQEQQKIMMFFFPLIFGFLFYHFPSGLTLYWVSYTILSVLSQRRLGQAKVKKEQKV
ncbi:YidC/Oxa1 family insertase periplasmic-domain containing protein, partial [bacterium]|nr:YidC/Oxa1 family insertase periplasmic-domain containing protein [bacterium]